MTPRTAKNLSIVAFAALILPVRNLLALLEALVAVFFHIPFPIQQTLFVLKRCPGPRGTLTVFIVNLIPMAIAAILAFCLYRYLLPRDFPLVIADCAARKGRIRTLAFLFVFFSIFQFVARSVPQPVMDATVRTFLKYPSLETLKTELADCKTGADVLDRFGKPSFHAERENGRFFAAWDWIDRMTAQGEFTGCSGFNILVETETDKLLSWSPTWLNHVPRDEPSFYLVGEQGEAGE
jgi:hypothetical protein